MIKELLLSFGLLSSPLLAPSIDNNEIIPPLDTEILLNSSVGGNQVAPITYELPQTVSGVQYLDLPTLTVGHAYALYSYTVSNWDTILSNDLEESFPYISSITFMEFDTGELPMSSYAGLLDYYLVASSTVTYAIGDVILGGCLYNAYDAKLNFGFSTFGGIDYLSSTVSTSGNYKIKIYDPSNVYGTSIYKLVFRHASRYGLAYVQAYSAGYSAGYDNGRSTGYTIGYSAGVATNDDAVYDNGYAVGYAAGFRDGQSAATSYDEDVGTLTRIFAAVVGVPIDVLNGVSSFTLWNIPIVSILFSFLMIAAIFWLIKRMI